MKSLDIVNMPLFGRSLIEASAGTGKTYTISNLILRLILTSQQGLGSDPLKINDILVVTFTKAATQELKDRIREKITAAQRYVESGKSDDPLLQQLVDHAVAKDGDRETIYLRCREAALYLDDAPIFTIHGFCQRVLSEYSFLTGQSYLQNLVENNQDILLQLAQQLWREKVYPAGRAETVLMTQHWRDPDALYLAMRNLLDCELHEARTLPAFDGISSELLQAYQQAQTIWQQQKDEIRCLFENAKLGASYRSNHMPARFDALASFLQNDDLCLASWDSKVAYFTQRMLDEKGKEPLSHPLFALLDRIEQLQSLCSAALQADFRAHYMQLLEAYQREHATLFFDDLVKKLAQAVSADNPAAPQLLQRLRQQYPVALIDEFQDTDLWQYTIFRELYPDSEGLGLLMIGDPKQAIYSFRGADIYTYFQARDDVAEDKRYTLATNWRSQPQLVSNINRLFSQQVDAFVQKGFPEYPQVDSPEKFTSKRGLQTQQAVSSVSVLSLEGDEKSKIDGLRQQAADRTADYIQQLLQQSATLNDKMIKAGDIAILVRKGSQAQLVKQALSRRQINSVYLAKDSVLNSEEATAFLRLLQACVDPYSTTAICTALGDQLIAYSAAEVETLLNDGDAFFAVQQTFLQAHTLWQRRGFMPMWQQMVAHFGIAEKRLQLAEGERSLTNLNQLAEIFQQLDNSRLGFAQQLERFQQWIHQAEENNDMQKLRLETEANLVEIVTVHASKGLEYPLVCCPFLFENSGGPRGGSAVVFDEKTQQRQLHWQVTDEAEKQTQQADFAEDIRLLYVAVTRAAYHLNFCWGWCKGVDKTPLWHLLYHRSTTLKSVDQPFFWRPFEQLEGCVIDPVITAGENVAVEKQTRAQLSLPEFKRELQSRYVARSYSALLNAHSSSDQEHKDIGEQETPQLPVADVAFAYNIFHFPKGAEAGNFMHQVLENVSFQASDAELLQETEKQLEHYGFTDESWRAVIGQHFRICLDKTLPQAGCSLAELPAAQVAKEMDFHLHANAFDGQQLARLLSGYREGSAVPEMNAVEGLFKGFIDLVFEHGGCYYLLDYKSNFLGFTEESYTHDAMLQAIESHFYDLQYLIYLAALQRYLKGVLPDYDYDRDIGGVYYLFLRGINVHDDAGIFYAKPPRKLIDTVEAIFAAGAFAEEVA